MPTRLPPTIARIMRSGRLPVLFSVAVLTALLAVTAATWASDDGAEGEGETPAATSTPAPPIQRGGSVHQHAAPDASELVPPGTEHPDHARTPSPTPSPAETPAPTPSPVPAADQPARATPSLATLEALTLGSELSAPCAVAAGGDGRLFVAEAGGTIHMLDAEGGDLDALHALRVSDDVDAGIRGLAADPSFPERPYLYVMYTSDGNDGPRTRIARLDVGDRDDTATDRILLDHLPAGSQHNGGALAFGPDGMLYATLGDTGVPSRAAHPASMAGSVLRIDPDGEIPPDNPIAGSPVYSYGHHNPTALTWDADGMLHVADREQGSGGRIDRIEPGDDYGWPARHDRPDGYPEPVATLPGVPQLGGALFLDAAQLFDDAPEPEAARLLVALHGEPALLALEPDEDGGTFTASEDHDWVRGPLCGLTRGPEGEVYAGGEDRLLRIGDPATLRLRYPDIRTQPPSNVSFDQAWIEGERRPVLRFTNTVVNLGEGPLEIVTGDGERALQRIYADSGAYLERDAGRLIYHWSHAHFHFEHFNRFELWEREDYERMLDGDGDVEPQWFEDKVSMCLMDLILVAEDLPGTPAEGPYASACDEDAQGISVGWGDIYYFDIPEQWVVVDGDFTSGEYVLRSIVDSENIFHESPGGRNEARESHHANGAATWFTIRGDSVTITHTESGADRLD